MSKLTSAIKSTQDFNNALQLTRLLLLPFGLWPSKSRIYQKFLRPIAIFSCIFSMLFVIIPPCLFVFLIVKDIGIRLKFIGPLGFSLMSLFKYIRVIMKEREMSECIHHMSEDWQEIRDSTERKFMLDRAKTSKILTLICVLFMYGGGMPYVTILPLSRGAVIRGNVSYRSLAYPSYFGFFDPQVRPIYDFIFAAQCICGFIRYSVTCGVYSIAIVCIMHICSQVGITSRMLERLADNFDEQLLGKIIKQHLRFLRFASKLETIFNEICLVEVVGSTGIICFLGYYLITEYEQREAIATITYFLLLMSFVFNIFILCYIGEILTEQCNSRGQAAYSMEWYKLSSKEARNVILIIMSTQRPVQLTAGKIVKLSLKSFSNVMKASASYLNMLRTVTANTT